MEELYSRKVYEDILDYDYRGVDIKTLDKDSLTYTNFFENYLKKNVPCIIKNISSSWECYDKWVLNNEINLEYLSNSYGDLDAPVADCNLITYDSQTKNIMKFRDYVNYLSQSNKDKMLYLKDWHLRREKPNDKFYETPILFAADWLNEYAVDHEEDDFMFVYIGPKNSWTPLHVDVYNSYSWSVNIVGCKKWIFFPPGEEDKLRDSFGKLPLLFDPQNFKHVVHYEIIQERGDAIFVPSGWHHQVINILDTISINHNWVNACNIKFVWQAMNTCLISVEKEIIELKDTLEYASQCQLILKSLFGLDYTSFVSFLCYIGEKRISQLLNKQTLTFDMFASGKNLIMFDLNVIVKVMDLIILDKNNPLTHKYLSPNIKLKLNETKMKILNIVK